MSQLAQAKSLHDRGVQLFEEARRGLTDALGTMSEASEKLSSGELTDEARALWKEKFEQAHTDAKELKDRAAKLAQLSDGSLEGFEKLASEPRRIHPVGDGAGGEGSPEPAEALSGDLGTASPDWGPEDPAKRILLKGRARTLLNRVLRPKQLGGGIEKLSAKEREFLGASRVEKLMSPYIDRDGATVIAEEVRNEVIGHLRDDVYIRDRARVIATQAAAVSFPTFKVDLRLVKTRASRAVTGDPTLLKNIFGKTQFVPSGSARIVKIPVELIEDETYDVVSHLTDEISGNELEHEEELFLLGTGSGEPLGLLTALQRLETAGFTGLGFDHGGAAGADFIAEDIRKFPLKLKKKYRGRGPRGGSWIASRAWLESVSVMRTDEGGAGTGPFMFQQSGAPGMADTVGMFPFLESEFFPDNVASGSAGDPLALFAALWHYWIVDRKSLEVRVLQELYAETQEVGYQYRKRFDGAPTRADACVYMKRKA